VIRSRFRTAFRAAAFGLGLTAAGLSAPGSAVAQAIDEVDPEQPVSQASVDVAAWAIASGDNRGLPFAVIDKAAAQVLVFDADGRLQGLAPVLIGSAFGDHSTPGVGDRELSEIAPEMSGIVAAARRHGELPTGRTKHRLPTWKIPRGRKRAA